MKKARILWVGDAVATTGFARVAHSILEHLKEQYHVAMIGINYFGDPHPYDYPIYPARSGWDLFGLDRLIEIINREKPDLIFILNDPWVIMQYLQVLKDNDVKIPVVVYFPVDGIGLSQQFFVNWESIVTEVVTYTEFGKREFLKSKRDFPEDRVHVIPHGINTDDFYPIEKESARRKVFSEDVYDKFKDSFIVLNANRNQPRKRIDLTIWAFSEFAKNKADVNLYLHMGIIDEGINIVEACNWAGVDSKLILSGSGNSIPGVPIPRLNEIYNSCDVGINTSTGEGWGLTNWEHAATGKLQIVPKHSACAEIWGDGSGILIEPIQPFMNPKINTIGHVPSITSLASILEAVYEDWKYKESESINKISEKAYNKITSLEYSWKTISGSFDKIIEKALCLQ